MTLRKSLRASIPDAIIYTVLIAAALAMLFPFVYVIAVSFTDPAVYVTGDVILFPKQWSLDSYRYILSSNSFLYSFRSTVFITIVGTVLNLAFSMTFAYALTKKQLPGRGIMLSLVLFTFLFGAGLVPNFLLIRELGLLDSLWSLILPGLTNAWSIFVLKSFIQGLPESLEEAALIDGCNELKVFYRIILPLSLPALAAFGLFFAVGQWNTYFSAVMYIQDAHKWPLQVLLQQLMVSQSAIGSAEVRETLEHTLPEETVKMAALVVVMVPILAVYPFLQKYFAKGVLLGSVKG
jgi:putative aldouronate transport system permease protein